MMLFLLTVCVGSYTTHLTAIELNSVGVGVYISVFEGSVIIKHLTSLLLVIFT